MLQRYAFNLDFPNVFREICLWGREFNAKSSNSHIFHPSSSLFSLKVWKFRYILLHLHRRTHAGPSSKTMSIQGWRDFAIAEVDLRVVGGHYFNVKASLTLCLLASLNVGNSKLLVKWQCQKWLLRVWNNCIPGCAREGILYSLMHTYTEIRADTGVGRHSTRHTQGLFLRPRTETSGGGSPRFAFQ